MCECASPWGWDTASLWPLVCWSACASAAWCSGGLRSSSSWRWRASSAPCASTSPGRTPRRSKVSSVSSACLSGKRKKTKTVLENVLLCVLQIAASRTTSSPSFSPLPPSWTASRLCRRVSSTTTLAQWRHGSWQCESDLGVDLSDWEELQFLLGCRNEFEFVTGYERNIVQIIWLMSSSLGAWWLQYQLLQSTINQERYFLINILNVLLCFYILWPSSMSKIKNISNKEKKIKK